MGTNKRSWNSDLVVLWQCPKKVVGRVICMQSLLRLTLRQQQTRLFLTYSPLSQPFYCRRMSTEKPNLHKDPVTGEMISKSCVLLVSLLMCFWRDFGPVSSSDAMKLGPRRPGRPRRHRNLQRKARRLQQSLQKSKTQWRKRNWHQTWVFRYQRIPCSILRIYCDITY